MATSHWQRSGIGVLGAATPMRPGHRIPPTAAWLVVRIFAGTFLGALATFAFLDLLASFIDKFDTLMGYGLMKPAGLEYLLMKMPLMIGQLMPVACLAGVLMGLGMLNRNGELLALQGLGISRVGIALPLLLTAALISVAAFGLNETIVPAATRRSKYLLDVVIRKDPGFFYTTQNWLRTRDGFVAVKSYDGIHKRLLEIKFFKIGPDYTLDEIYSADTAQWNGTDWTYSGLRMLQTNGGTPHAAPSPPAFHLEARPGDFSFAILSPEEFSLSELNEYIAKLRRNGLDPGSYLVDRDVKYALPLSCLVMMFCGLSLSLDPVPRASNAGRAFILGLGIGIGYWVTLGFTISFGRSGLMAPWLAAWLPNFLFSMLALAIFISGEES